MEIHHVIIGNLKQSVSDNSLLGCPVIPKMGNVALLPQYHDWHVLD